MAGLPGFLSLAVPLITSSVLPRPDIPTGQKKLKKFATLGIFRLFYSTVSG